MNNYSLSIVTGINPAQGGKFIFFKEKSMNKKFKLFNVGIAVLAAVIFVLAGCEQTVLSPVADSGGAVPGISLSAGDPSVEVGYAVVDDVTITGASYSAISAEVVIGLGNNAFGVIGEGTDVTSWFTNRPDGLTAVSAVDATYSDTITITVGGIPSMGSAQVLAITIPANMLYIPGSDITVNPNPNAKYDITATIGNEKDLQVFANAVAAGDAAQKGKLASSTTVVTVPSGANYVPIARDWHNSYTGTFDGNGGTININLAGNTSYLALFGVNNGTIKNLTVTGSVTASKNAPDPDYIAGVVAYNDIGGTIQRVVANVTITADPDTTHNIGGIAGFNGWDQYNSDSPHYNQGWVAGGTIYQCKNLGNISGGFNKTGGIVGENAYIVKECMNSGTITGTKTGSGWPGIGGIVGRNGNNNTATEKAQIITCYNWGVVADNTGGGTTHNAYGGITGWCNDLSLVVNCYTVGQFTQQGGSVNGSKNPIIGMADNPSTTMANNNYARDDIYAYNKGNIPLTGTPTSDTVMRSPAFVAMINQGGAAGAYVASNTYPIFDWE
jgi:hypothetical protein